MLVGITGRARSGKDTAAEVVRDRLRLPAYAFADPLKEAAVCMFGISRTMAYGHKNYDREQIVPEWGISVREMLQKLGTECARQVFHPDFWVIRAESELSFKHKYRGGAVISDVRFDNEAQWIKNKGGIVIEITRHTGGLNHDHASEKGVNPDLVDAVIENNGSISALDHTISAYLKHRCK